MTRTRDRRGGARARRAARCAARAGDAGEDGNTKRLRTTAEAFTDPALRRRAMRLDERLADAIACENFAAAANVRDELRALRRRDPLARAEDDLAELILREDYEKAASVKMLIEELERDAVVDGLSPCESDRTTRGVRVRVKSRCVIDRSSPKESMWFFQYVVTITNVSDSSVKLLSRSWLITDDEGRTEAVRGAGVVGKQPTIKPGASFEYASSTPLKTKRGTMEGFYRFVAVDAEEASRAESVTMDLAREDDPSAFNVEIGVFGLSESATS